MIFFALIACMTAAFVLLLDRALIKDKAPPKLRFGLIILIPILALGLYIRFGNLIFV